MLRQLWVQCIRREALCSIWMKRDPFRPGEGDILVLHADRQAECSRPGEDYFQRLEETLSTSSVCRT